MMPVTFKAALLTADEAIKQKTALVQMRELLERVSSSKKYRTLTLADRKTLKSEGYANDLVDNLVFITERFPSPGLEGNQHTDQIVTGFTYAAFDPSLYACATIAKNLTDIHEGRCAFCETFLDATESGQVTAFRPNAIVFDQDIIKRSPYYLQAYQQQNLFYACTACADTYKNAKFPVIGPRNADSAQENALLISPYSEQPRNFVRFNPLNATAYPFDVICQFFLASRGFSTEQTEQFLWQSPSNIPLQYDAKGNGLSDNTVNQQFIQWKNNQIPNKTRGQASIECFGLNRTSLVQARLQHLRQLQASYSNTGTPSDLSNAADVTTWLNTQVTQQLQYHSLTLDYLHTYVQQVLQKPSTENEAATGEAENNSSPTNTGSDDTNSEKSVINPSNLSIGSALYSLTDNTPAQAFPVWIMSSLLYMVLENELHIANKRRLINLSSDDYLYGSDNPDKCVFMPIDWEKDTNNVIKVRSKINIWETSFHELAASRPMEIRSLFANNEIWVEGNFAPLA